ncbi:MAG: MFS transporter, partial [Chloroflexi bacterium]|nr:MFS transporter [Chloroflexota bacterium]
RVAGAGLAGVLLIPFDYGEVYLLIALIDGVGIWMTFQIRAPAAPETRGQRERRSASLLSDFMEGLRHVNRDRKVLYLVGTALLLFVLGQPYQQVSVPLLALDVLHLGRSGAGWMLALIGVGALLGSFTVASKGRLARRGLLMLGLLVVFGLALILLSQSRWLPLSAVALLVAGSVSTTYMALNNSLILEQTPPEFHGRVMSLMSLDRGLVSLGAILSGGLAQLWGPQLGLTVLAGVCLGLTLLAAVALPVLRRMQ